MSKVEIETVFDYKEVLKAAKKRFTDKSQVSSNTIFDWFHEIGVSKFVRYELLDRLMLKLRMDLWEALDK